MSSISRPHVAVVGAGLGGLSAAIRLAGAGYRVSVYDKQPGPGGKAFTEQIGAYRFDTGPSLFTLREVFAQLFSQVGRRLEDYLQLSELDVICRYFWEDGTRLNSYRDRERMAAEFSRALGEPAEHLQRYLDYSARIHRITSHLFLEKSLHEWSTYGSRQFWTSLLQLHRIDALRSMDRANRGFFQSPRLQQFFNRYATYNGSDPYQTPATLNIIPHVEYGLGAWAVHGGIHQLPQALDRLARELGVRLHYNTPVRRIRTRGHDAGMSGPPRRRADRQVTGLELLSGDRVDAEVVVSNADVTPTYEYLLEDTRARLYKRYQRLEPSSSGLVFYWGVRRRFPELGLHNIFFSRDYEEEFRHIFQEQRCPDDPTIYLNITAREGSPQDAPPDGENWFILVNAPADRGQDWEAEAARTRERVLQRLSAELQAPLADLIEVESRMTPPDISRKTDSHRGSLYGISSNSRLAAFLRHPNRSRRYPGLYVVGGSAHPGGGMPLVVLGGRIVADLVSRHHPLAPEARAAYCVGTGGEDEDLGRQGERSR